MELTHCAVMYASNLLVPLLRSPPLRSEPSFLLWHGIRCMSMATSSTSGNLPSKQISSSCALTAWLKVSSALPSSVLDRISRNHSAAWRMARISWILDGLRRDFSHDETASADRSVKHRGMQHAGVKVACSICRVVPFGDLGGRHDAFPQHLLNRFIYFAIVHHIASQAIFLVVHKDRLGAPSLICLHQVPDLAHLGLLCTGRYADPSGQRTRCGGSGTCSHASRHGSSAASTISQRSQDTSRRRKHTWLALCHLFAQFVFQLQLPAQFLFQLPLPAHQLVQLLLLDVNLLFELKVFCSSFFVQFLVIGLGSQ